MNKILKATYGTEDKPLIIGEIEISCFVLENEKRVITQSGLLKAIGLSTGGAKKEGSRKIDEFLDTSSISPFVDADIKVRARDIIQFKIKGGVSGIGYDATMLVDICDAILQADRKNKLHPKQKHLAERAEILYRAFAKVGIIALVDEATGYQQVRDRNALYKILEAYISPTLLPWTKKFPDEFYKEIFRLNGWNYDPSTINRPSVIGTWTNQFIYDQLPNGVLEELKHKTPKHRHLHRSLTIDVGHPHLNNQLAAVTAIMRLSTNWRNFKANFSKAFKTGEQSLNIDNED